MPIIQSFRGLRPAAEYASGIIAPPYDVVDTAEARSLAAGNPLNFIHVSRPEVDLPETVHADDPMVYARGAANLRRLIDRKVLIRDSQPSLYVYRLRQGDHVQTGMVTTVSVADYLANRIRRHEHTRPEKEDDRVRHIQALNAQTGPALLVFRDDERARGLIAEATNAPALYADLELDGVRHSLWRIADADEQAAAQQLFESMEAFYIADGHHRSAAAARVAAQRPPRADDSSQFFLAVLFPACELRVLDYNRVVRDLNGLTEAQFVERVSSSFEMSVEAAPVRPEQRGEFGMYLGGRWYRLRIRRDSTSLPDLVARLDVSLLANHVIEPILGIDDPRRDPRIDFVGGIRGLEALQARVDHGGMAVAFSLYPTSLEDMMAVADDGRVMPPKSTWFEPKLADGLISYLLY